MIRARLDEIKTPAGIPRESGDDPPRKTRGILEAMYSPRERG